MTQRNQLLATNEHLIASSQRRIVVEKNTDPEKVYAIGMFFKEKFPHLLTNCCEGGIVGAMNRWIPGKIEQQRVERITETIVAKTPGVREAEVIRAILDSIEDAYRAHRARIWL